MKDFFKNVSSGIIGGLIVAGLFYFNTNVSNEKAINDNNPAKTVAAYTTNSPIGADFVTAASKGTAAVVHIAAKESVQLAQDRMQQNKRSNPFGELFSMDDFFGGGDFFGRNFYQPRKGSGSGVIYTKDGYIITNNHVVEFADEIIVTTQDKKSYKATKIGTDPSTDLAVIKIESPENLNTIVFDNSDDVKVGEWVLAVGNPFDYLTSTVTAGIVSAKGRELDIIKGEKTIEEFIQTDAAVNPGNSGGALVNTKGNLVGINTAIATPTGVYAGYSFAIPSNLVKTIVKDLIENGDIERGSLGIAGYDINPEDVESLGLSTNSGFYVEEVLKRSAAQFGGILPGDVVVGINTNDIKSYDQLVEVLKYAKVGDTLDVKINRNGKEMTLKIQLRKGI
jgi:Do/DeqQ family serine protease